MGGVWGERPNPLVCLAERQHVGGVRGTYVHERCVDVVAALAVDGDEEGQAAVGRKHVHAAVLLVVSGKQGDAAVLHPQGGGHHVQRLGGGGGCKPSKPSTHILPLLYNHTLHVTISRATDYFFYTQSTYTAGYVLKLTEWSNISATAGSQTHNLCIIRPVLYRTRWSVSKGSRNKLQNGFSIRPIHYFSVLLLVLPRRCVYFIIMHTGQGTQKVSGSV